MTTPTSSEILEHLEDRLLRQIAGCYVDRGAALAPLRPYESVESGLSEKRIAELHQHDWSDSADTRQGERLRRAVLGLVERELVTRVVLNEHSAGQSDEAEQIALVKPTRAGLKWVDYLEASRPERARLWWTENWRLVVIPAVVSLLVTCLTLLAARSIVS